ncbi:hypothetical protein BG006_003777 [Podila minutissima]|uniref:Uncharacterized protein n=1 Tax=Podila minutissima TaxID=64525 RepID=A0A9P5S861_9FUNG|nr:hypothetical protein BG006_003777 [Podila minutissima]
MGNYYESETDPETEETIYVAKKSLSGIKAKQVSCPSCVKPVVELLRYGRRIKDAQLSIRLTKYQIIQENEMTHIKIQLDVARAQLEKGSNGFVQALCKVRTRNVDNPPLPETRKLGKLALKSARIPNSDFWTIAETYEIPPTHRDLWLKHIQPVVKVVQELDEINKRAARPPTKQVFEAAVSRLFRLKDRRLSAESTDQDAASAIINECIRNCGVIADGGVGPSYVESLAEKTNALLLVLSEATATMEFIGPKTGWYWFVEDLRICCSVYNNITMEAALKGRFDRRVAYSRVTLLEIMCSRFHWMGLRQFPDNKADKEVRLGQVENLMERFTLEKELLNTHCPDSIKDECLDRVKRIEEKMVMAVKMARGELPLNPGLTKTEKIPVHRAIATTLSK